MNKALRELFISNNYQMNNTLPNQNNKKESTYKSAKMPYTRDDIKNWISFGINNGYVNKFKKDEIAKWTDLMLKHGVIQMEGMNREL